MNDNIHWRIVREEVGLDRISESEVEALLGVTEDGAMFSEAVLAAKERVDKVYLGRLKRLVKKALSKQEEVDGDREQQAV